MPNSDDLRNNTTSQVPLNVVVPMSGNVMDDVLTPLTEWLEQQEALPIGPRMALRLILEELLANTVMHGDPPEGSPVQLRLDMRSDAVEIRFRDSGVAFNPQTDLPPDTREDEEDDRPVGQLGWPLILHYCSITDYQRVDEQNRLTLTFGFKQ